MLPGQVNADVDVEALLQSFATRLESTKQQVAVLDQVLAESQLLFPHPLGPSVKLRTANDEPVPADEALQLLREGNRRFLRGSSAKSRPYVDCEDWRDMVQAGQSPFAAVLGCADSRCPVETLFDAKPGDIFVCRNAGNTCSHAEGSMVGSLEFCVSALRTRLVVVLGHTKCGALKGAAKTWQEKKRTGPAIALEVLLQGLLDVADRAATELGPQASEEDVARRSVPVNVMRTVDFLLEFSQPIREAVRAGTLQVHGAVFHIENGEVELMGQSPRQVELLQSQERLPKVLKPLSAPPDALRLRSAKDAPVPARQALQILKEGNQRFLDGTSFRVNSYTSAAEWRDMVQVGQSPFAAVLGCADSRCPVETLFDAKPGDIFVCRNAGNTCSHAEGSMVGSLEFCVNALHTRLVVVLGHTKCGALKGAANVWAQSKQQKKAGRGMALDVMLEGLVTVAESAARELGPEADEASVAALSVGVNVMRTVEFLLQYSKSLREGVKAGTVQVEGAVFHIETGRVEFLGESPYQDALLQSQELMPPTCQALNAHEVEPRPQRRRGLFGRCCGFSGGSQPDPEPYSKGPDSEALRHAARTHVK